MAERGRIDAGSKSVLIEDPLVNLLPIDNGIRGSFDAEAHALNTLEAEVGAAMGNSALWVAFYDTFKPLDSNFGVDIMASHKFGAATFYLGYIITGVDTGVTAIPVDGGEWSHKTGGLYAGMKADL